MHLGSCATFIGFDMGEELCDKVK